MPINIPNSLPAVYTLECENIFTIMEDRASMQDIRPLRIVILNLMPKKTETETQLLRVLSNTPLQVDIELMQMSTHISKNTPVEHLLKFYKSFDDLKHQRFDGMIVTGAPVEHMEFEDVDYWPELVKIMDWAKTNVYSTFFICWGAQAGLYHYYNINKYPLDKKCFGVFDHRNLNPNHPIMRGFDEIFKAPHSRHTQVKKEDILANDKLILLSDSKEAGVYIVASTDNRQFFITGHSEYDRTTLADEYFRDINSGLDIDLPKHYFPNDNPSNIPSHIWRGHSHLLFSNWLNYFVYQATPYDLSEL